MKVVWATLLILFYGGSLCGCTSSRAPIPPGEIPTQTQVSLEEEEYGQEVFRQLSGQFELDRDDDRINRARRLVDRLTTVRGNNQNIWHVYVFKHNSFHNAGATWGNYIFVWSALLDAVPDDGELTTILAHEIGHVLAGHTMPDPVEEVNEMLASLAGRATRDIMLQTGGSTVIGLAGLGGLLASELIKVLIVNPDQQSQELEADQLGIFIMAEAGYDPEKAISFWERAQNDPNFKSAPIEFLSTHPSSETRLDELKKFLPEAKLRYEQVLQGGTPPQNPPSSTTQTPQPSTTQPPPLSTTQNTSPPIGDYWVAAIDSIPVHSSPSPTSSPIGTIRKGERVLVKERLRRWLSITSPYEGFVKSPHFFPEN